MAAIDGNKEAETRREDAKNAILGMAETKGISERDRKLHMQGAAVQNHPLMRMMEKKKQNMPSVKRQHILKEVGTHTEVDLKRFERKLNSNVKSGTPASEADAQQVNHMQASIGCQRIIADFEKRMDEANERNAELEKKNRRWAEQGLVGNKIGEN
ncbi:hypothetical protein ACFQ14_07710 [Pseudahrensia aquimaris]|uniref:Uncharacterized protein n=1 Tax=Pseudahrensia aquimaris TaxID=744461 RepID=A0ABW3FJG2_9HYPH